MLLGNLSLVHEIGVSQRSSPLATATEEESASIWIGDDDLVGRLGAERAATPAPVTILFLFLGRWKRCYELTHPGFYVG
jgi:hypothetical protein